VNKRCANRLSSSEIENRANASNISNVIKTSSRNRRDMVSKGKFGIKNKTKIASWGWRKNRDTIPLTKWRTLYFIQLSLEAQQQEFDQSLSCWNRADLRSSSLRWSQDKSANRKCYHWTRDLRSFVIRFDFESYVRFEIRFVVMVRFEIFESSALSIVIRKETIGVG